MSDPIPSDQRDSGTVHPIVGLPIEPDDDPRDEYDETEWCQHCNNLGYMICHCGGDICVCSNNGEYPCPYCS